MLNASELQITTVFFALSDKTRFSIIKKLYAAGGVTATVLAYDKGVTRQNITKHLKTLENAGIIRHQKHGREVLYTLEPAQIEAARIFLDDIAAGWDRKIVQLRKTVEQ